MKPYDSTWEAIKWHWSNYWPAYVFSSVVIGLLCFIYVFCSYDIDAQYHRGYAAWCKQTGNEKHLTYQEWYDLTISTRTHDTTYIYIHQ